MTCRHALPGGVFNCRILGLVLSPRYGGSVVIDGFGIAPVPTTKEEARDPNRRTSLRTLNFRELRDGPMRKRFLERYLTRCVATYRPTLAVLGLLDRRSPPFRSAHVLARRFLERRGIVVIEASVASARRLLFGRAHGKERDEFPNLLAAQFFPELAHPSRKREGGRYQHHAWNALALTVVTLAKQKPLSALALAQPHAVFPATFSNLLSHAVH